MSVLILGAGAFGTALAISLARSGADVVLWARQADQARAMQAQRENVNKLPGINLPDQVSVISDLANLAIPKAILLAVPAQSTSALLTALGPALPLAPLVLCAKGIETATGNLQSQIASERLPNHPVAVLTGPGFAGEIAAGLPTALTLACADMRIGPELQRLLSNSRLRLYLTRDIRGAQIGGALKNVIALACGMSVGAALGESARAALLTRGFAEMNRLALAMGAEPATLTGLSGLGDLALTCTSVRSRNFANGFALGAGQAAQTGTVEGIATAAAACSLARRFNVELPIAEAVNAVLGGHLSIARAMALLLTRPLRAEHPEGSAA